MPEPRTPLPAPARAQDDLPAVREPLQARSKESFARVQDAALSLLRERGDDSFTLAEVSERSGVSTGSIYGRVRGKDALLRLVHERELERIDAETLTAFAAAATGQDTLTGSVRALVTALARMLQAEAGVLRPFMLRAVHDPEVARLGRHYSDREIAVFCDALLRHRAQIRRADPETAVAWCHTVVYSVIARRLGLGSTAEGASGPEVDVMVDRLSSMVSSYLLTPDAD
ncbi:TetR/AcrR family transcriptional regulator [Kineococcus rhizosphaerae]|uniref:TetR family transcriptional regulator n=1 Tax=Kineococcus rhizosphaerae TaxID=559628 RepID=A0A2T0R1H3_9ACTN|nr:TetR/AcrR family transcriptional regulator [Kineococcus rhizosphaerae]PRY13402.1 TetR family transcriptional regulator [Kineococcus rhizosphaerae]